jgi:uncharacterized membrane protein
MELFGMFLLGAVVSLLTLLGTIMYFVKKQERARIQRRKK